VLYISKAKEKFAPCPKLQSAAVPVIIMMTRRSVEGHDVFFSRIIAMISTDLYKHSNDSDALEDESSKYYKHKKVALGADEKKIASCKKRQLKYSAPVESTETECADNDIQLQTSVDHSADDTEERDVADDDSEGCSSTSLDDLRQRLQRRILGLKSQRSTTKERDPTSNSEKSTAARKKARNEHVKRKPSRADDSSESKMVVDDTFQQISDENGRSSSNHVDSVPIEDFGDVQFSLITAKKSADESKNSSLSKPGTKMKRLKRMLETADKKRQRLDELKSAGSAGANRLKQEQWTDVLKSATGEKTLNDTTKLRKAIKKREKKKETSAREWKVQSCSFALLCVILFT
jgi:Surfeit locus protein 6